MNKKITIGLLSLLAVFFLTAQTCNYGALSTGQESDCAYDGEILCDEDDSTTALECSYNGYGGFYLSDATDEDDIEYCGAEDTLADTDEDGLTDYDEINTYYTDPEDRDSDDDGALDGEEVVDGTDPMDATSAEVTSTSTFPTRTMSSSDSDSDGLTDLEEVAEGTDPDDVDSDDDYLSDYDELNTYGTDPNNADTDGDTYSDYDEINVYGTNPRSAGSHPFTMMTAPSSLGTRVGVFAVTSETTDTDGDGMPDTWEETYGFNPDNAGTASGDADGDGITNLEEYEAGTDPTNTDTDGDGYSDYDESITYSTNPLDDADTPLVVDCGMSETEMYVGVEKTFDGSASVGEIDFYEWDWGDDTADTSMPGIGSVSAMTHEYATEGLYLPALTITDIYGNTAMCNLIATVQNTDEEIEDVQLFKLENMAHYTTSGASDENFPVTAITEESWRERDSKTIKNSKLVDSYSAGKDAGYYLDFYSGTSTPRDVIFGDADYLKPSDWIIIQVQGKINAVSFGDNHAYMLAKTTETCGKPVYAIFTYDSHYKFSIMIENTEYTLTSDSEVESSWQEIRGVYTGDEIQLYVDDVLEDSQSVSGEISSSAAANSLVFGYDTACSDYQYHGYIDDIFIYGE